MIAESVPQRKESPMSLTRGQEESKLTKKYFPVSLQCGPTLTMDLGPQTQHGPPRLFHGL